MPNKAEPELKQDLAALVANNFEIAPESQGH
jgi:hypothetical protein